MRDTHAHHTARTHRPGAGVRGLGRRAPELPFPQAPVPLPVVRVEAKIWGQPRPSPTVPTVGTRHPAISGGWSRGFCPSCPLGSGWQEGSFWRLPKKDKRRTFPHRRQEIRHPNAWCKMQTHRRHTHTFTHTLTRNFTFLL
uniref:Uncharacterized protein n=1 Tax=Molossus molossus TaxID=27622 RepID=A0A7J8CZN7_MOLMO|nr:hypothetical protein HJG59_009492 [Molossus molossus]